MILSKGEISGFIIAIIVVAIMGVIAFTGPYHAISKTVKSSFPTEHVKIVNDPKTIGRFTPTTTTVHVGQKIVFANASSVDHTATAQDDTFDSRNIGTGQSWTYTASSVGTFAYVCSYHPLMKGTIVVLG